MTKNELLHKSGATLRPVTAAERAAANTDAKRNSDYILRTRGGSEWYSTGTYRNIQMILGFDQAETNRLAMM